MKIIQLTPADEKRYTDFLLRDPQSLLYVSLPYRDLICRHLSCRSIILAAEAGNELLGAYPMMFSRQGKYGPVANSLPYYGSNGGILTDPGLRDTAEEQQVWKALLDAGEKLVREQGCAALTVVESPFDPHKQWYNAFFQEDCNDYRIGQLTFLPEDSADLPERLLALYHSKTRNLVRKAWKCGIEVKDVTGCGFDFLWETHAENMKQIGGIAKSRSFFDDIPVCFAPADYRIFTAFHQGEPVAALLMFYFNRTAEYFTPVIKAEFRELQPMCALIHYAMQDAVKRGFRCWNWGGTWATQDGVYHFKSRWGTTDIRYNYHTKIFNPEVLKSTPKELLSEYPGFYVLPFAMLEAK